MSRRSLALGLAGLAVFVAAGPVGIGAPDAHAALPQGFLTATVTSSETAPFATATTYATTGTSTFKRTGKGRYTFFAARLGGQGNAQISMIDIGDRFPICTVSSQSRSSKGTTVKVRCNENNGSAIDADFSLFYNTTRISDPNVGYVAVSTSTAGSSTPGNQFRSRGTGKVTVKRISTGTYQVTVPGELFSENDGVVMTSATGSNVRYCNPIGWSPSGSDTIINVECRRGTGALNNANFSLVMTTRTILGTTGGIGASTWSFSGDRDISSALGPSNDFNSASGYNTDINGAMGETHLAFPDLLGTPGEIVKLAVAYGPHRCGTAPGTGLNDDDLIITVRCQTSAGSPIWTSFDAMVLVQPILT